MASIEVDRTINISSPNAGITVAGENLISTDEKKNVIIGDGTTEGPMNLLLGGDAPGKGKYRTALGIGSQAIKDYGLFARKDLDPVAMGASLAYDPATGQIGPLISSSRYKFDVTDLKIDSGKIYSLVPKSFKFLDGTESFGLIAEEVDKIIPELVVRDNYSVNYTLISILLLNECKKLRQEIDELKKKMG